MKKNKLKIQDFMSLCVLRLTRLFWIVLFAIPLLWLSSNASAFEDANSCEKINCETDFSALYKLANTGDKRAQFKVGLAYEKGKGVEKSDAQAAKWYEKASNQNELDARHNLALMYKTGNGVKQNLKRAFELEKSAADLGNKYAQNGLGLAYLKGYGTDKNVEYAIKWLTKAAENGLVEAQSNLGSIYENGDGVPMDSGKSFQWYQKAAFSGDSASQFAIGSMYLEGISAKKNNKLALEWFRKAAINDNKGAWIITGILLRGNHEGVTPNYKESFYWLKKSADTGNPDACKLIGDAYKYGIGVKEDINESNKWYELSLKIKAQTKNINR